MTGFTLWHVEVLFSDPAEEPDTLGEDGIALEIICRDGLRWNELGSERAAVSEVRI